MNYYGRINNIDNFGNIKYYFNDYLKIVSNDRYIIKTISAIGKEYSNNVIIGYVFIDNFGDDFFVDKNGYIWIDGKALNPSQIKPLYYIKNSCKLGIIYIDIIKEINKTTIQNISNYNEWDYKNILKKVVQASQKSYELECNYKDLNEKYINELKINNENLEKNNIRINNLIKENSNFKEICKKYKNFILNKI